ncbi:MAG: hypothetical protein M5T61_19685 [Acidimicrobiia bacterium]|nr:hypothetical protein [Acidimicrobiia bacterium]
MKVNEFSPACSLIQSATSCVFASQPGVRDSAVFLKGDEARLILPTPREINAQEWRVLRA